MSREYQVADSVLQETGTLQFQAGPIVANQTVSSGTTYNETASGGAATSGTATVQGQYTASPSGGAIAAGSALEQAAYTIAAAGTVVAGGSATESCVYTVTPSGGAIAGGEATVTATYTTIASGGAVGEGSGLESVVYTITPSGGAIAAGEATTQASYTIAAAGTVVSGGTASEACVYTITASGGAVAGGAGSDSVSATTIEVVGLPVRERYTLSSQIDPSPCNEARERWNWNRLHKMLGVLDDVFEILVSSDGGTVTINLTPDSVTADGEISSPRYTDDAGVTLCPRYCSQSAAEYVVQAYHERSGLAKKRRKPRRRGFEQQLRAGSAVATIVAGAIPP